MRALHALALDIRVRVEQAGGDGGAFTVRSPIDRRQLMVVASNGLDWDHVSVSRRDRCPTWAEMDYVKRIFFGDEVVMQLHVAAKDHINVHENCLHLWRPQHQDIPLPDKIMV